MLLVVMLLGYFCVIGLAVRRFGAGVRWLMLAGVVALVMLDFAARALP
jgi:hypothetical protein